MALIQYNLEETDEGYKVRAEVVEIDEGDRIQFKTKIAGAAIKYTTAPPFDAAKPGEQLPEANQPFPVNKTAGPFTVNKKLNARNRIHFDCGEVKQVAVSAHGGTPHLEFTSWKTGDGHPPQDQGN
jgi:hypothetical protein